MLGLLARRGEEQGRCMMVTDDQHDDDQPRASSMNAAARYPRAAQFQLKVDALGRHEIAADRSAGRSAAYRGAASASAASRQVEIDEPAGEHRQCRWHSGCRRSSPSGGRCLRAGRRSPASITAPPIATAPAAPGGDDQHRRAPGGRGKAMAVPMRKPAAPDRVMANISVVPWIVSQPAKSKPSPLVANTAIIAPSISAVIQDQHHRRHREGETQREGEDRDLGVVREQEGGKGREQFLLVVVERRASAPAADAVGSRPPAMSPPTMP